MSTAPHYVYGMRNGIKAGNQTMIDGMIHDGLWDSFGGNHMGEYAEYTATKAGISRKDQDEFAFHSHRKAVAAIEAGKFAAEIVPVEVKTRAGVRPVPWKARVAQASSLVSPPCLDPETPALSTRSPIAM